MPGFPLAVAGLNCYDRFSCVQRLEAKLNREFRTNNPETTWAEGEAEAVSSSALLFLRGDGASGSSDTKADPETRDFPSWRQSFARSSESDLQEECCGRCPAI